MRNLIILTIAIILVSCEIPTEIIHTKQNKIFEPKDVIFDNFEKFNGLWRITKLYGTKILDYKLTYDNGISDNTIILPFYNVSIEKVYTENNFLTGQNEYKFVRIIATPFQISNPNYGPAKLKTMRLQLAIKLNKSKDINTETPWVNFDTKINSYTHTAQYSINNFEWVYALSGSKRYYHKEEIYKIEFIEIGKTE